MTADADIDEVVLVGGMIAHAEGAARSVKEFFGKDPHKSA